jgi:toxin FitB
LKFLLDTDVFSRLRRPDRVPKLMAWIDSVDDLDVFLSVATIAEIERGIARQEKSDPSFSRDLRTWVDGTLTTFNDRIISFGRTEARVFGRLAHVWGHTNMDLVIAATALVNGATVVTGNVTHFRNTGVEIINPF